MEATRDAPCEPVPIRTPLARRSGRGQAHPCWFLCCGRGWEMVDRAHAALRRRTLALSVSPTPTNPQPVPYLDSLPDDLTDVPVIATRWWPPAESLTHTLRSADLAVQRISRSALWLRRGRSRGATKLRQTFGCSLRYRRRGLTGRHLCPVSTMPAIAIALSHHHRRTPSRQLIDPRPRQLSGNW